MAVAPAGSRATGDETRSRLLRPSYKRRPATGEIRPGEAAGGLAPGSGPPPLLRRERLHALLASPWKVALLAAPAGYGKTTLALEFAAAAGGLACRLRREDHDPSHLVEKLLAAAEKREPPLGDRTRRLFASRRDMERDGGLLAASLAEELATAAAAGGLMVALDDLQVLAGGRESLQWLARIMEESGPAVRFLVTCRGECPLPLTRLALQGGLVTIGAAELEFTAAEQAELFASSFGLGVTPEESASIRALVGGWAAGLALLAHERRRSGRAALPADWQSGAAGGAERLLDFLDEDVVAPLPRRLRRTLVRAALLEDLDPDALRFLLGRGDAEHLLVEVARRDLFVRSLPGSGAALRFHPLLAEALRRRFAAETDAAERVRLLTRLARYWMAHGEPGRAVRVLKDGGALEEAARLFEQAAETAAGANRRRGPARSVPVAPLAPIAPLALVAARSEVAAPWLELHGAYEARDAGRFDEAIQLARAAARDFLERHAFPQVARALGVEIRVAIMTGKFRGSLQQAGSVLRRIPARERAARGLVLMQLGELHLHAGRPERARVMLTTAERHLRATGHEIEMAEVSLRRATVAFTQGRWDAYLLLARHALGIFRHAGHATRAQSLLINMADASIYLGQEEKALAYLDEAEIQTARSSLPGNRAIAAIIRARAHSERGACDDAAPHFATAEDMVRRFGSPSAALILAVWSGVWARRRGDLDAAISQLSAAVDGFSRLDSPSWLAVARMERGLVRGLRGDPPAGLADLAAAARVSRRLGDRKELARNWLYAARVRALAGEEFAPTIRRALALLAREGYFILLRKEADVAAPLVGALAATGAGGMLLARASAALPETALPEGAPPEAAPPEAAPAVPLFAVRATGGGERPAVAIRLLGGFAVTIGGTPASFPRRASIALVARLALARGAACEREALAEALWPGAPPAASRNRFDVALSAARRILEPEVGPRGPFRVLLGESGLYRLGASDRATVDVEEFERLAAACEPVLADLARRPWSVERPRLAAAEVERRRTRVTAAVAAYRGELLPELRYASWAAAERERLRDRHQRLLVGLGALELAASRAAEAVALARRVLGEDPLSEEAERLLLRALAARREQSALIRSYRSFTRRMARELDLPPSPETEALFQELAGETRG